MLFSNNNPDQSSNKCIGSKESERVHLFNSRLNEWVENVLLPKCPHYQSVIDKIKSELKIDGSFATIASSIYDLLKHRLQNQNEKSVTLKIGNRFNATLTMDDKDQLSMSWEFNPKDLPNETFIIYENRYGHLILAHLYNKSEHIVSLSYKSLASIENASRYVRIEDIYTNITPAFERRVYCLYPVARRAMDGEYRRTNRAYNKVEIAASNFGDKIEIAKEFLSNKCNFNNKMLRHTPESGLIPQSGLYETFTYTSDNKISVFQLRDNRKINNGDAFLVIEQKAVQISVFPDQIIYGDGYEPPASILIVREDKLIEPINDFSEIISSPDKIDLTECWIDFKRHNAALSTKLKRAISFGYWA